MSREKKLRRPPAYRCYGSDLMNDQRYFLLNSGERGLFDSIRNVCWTNDSAPSDPTALAFAARLPIDNVKQDLPAVLKSGLIAVLPWDPTRLHVPELTDQMQELLGKRDQNAANGAKGGQETQRKSREARSSGGSTNRSSGVKCDEPNGTDTTRTESKSVYKDASSDSIDELPVPLPEVDDFVTQMEEEVARFDVLAGGEAQRHGLAVGGRTWN